MLFIMLSLVGTGDLDTAVTWRGIAVGFTPLCVSAWGDC